MILLVLITMVETSSASELLGHDEGLVDRPRPDTTGVLWVLSGRPRPQELCSGGQLG